MIQLWIEKNNDSGEKKFLSHINIFRCLLLDTHFVYPLQNASRLGAKSPKTPDIYIGVSLFDALFEKVRHFLTHLLEKCSTFWHTFFDDNFSCLGWCVTF